LVLNFFKKTKFRDYVSKFLSKGPSQILFVSGFEKNSFFILEVSFKNTNEKLKFIIKDFSWYTVPEMEEINYKSELHEILSDIKMKWTKGFYEAIRPSNSLDFIQND
jgi:hypothetical protein